MTSLAEAPLPSPTLRLVADYLPTAPYRGTRDFLPAEMSVRTQVFETLYDVIERYGYVRYDSPTLEPVEIYEAKSSQEIVQQQLYTLTDRGGRRLAIRPEMTPSPAMPASSNSRCAGTATRTVTVTNARNAAASVSTGKSTLTYLGPTARHAKSRSSS